MKPTPSPRTPSPRTAALVGAVLSVASLPLLTAPAMAEGSTTTYTKTLPYTCDVVTQVFGSTFPITNFPVTATVRFSVPALTPNSTLAPTNVDVDLNLGEALRASATAFIGGVSVEGQSTNVYLIERSEIGEREVFDIPRLSAARSDIPTESNAPWIVKASGQSPTINVLNTTKATISGPEKFDIDSTIHKADGTAVPTTLTCETEADRTVAVIPIGEPTTATIVSSPTFKAGSRTSSVKVQVRGAKTKPTGNVVLYLDGNLVTSIGDGELNAAGDVRITLPAFGKLGTRKLTAQYLGDGVHGALSASKTITVTRR